MIDEDTNNEMPDVDEANELELFQVLEQIPEMVGKIDSYHMSELSILESILKNTETKSFQQPESSFLIETIEKILKRSYHSIEYKLSNTSQLADRITASLGPEIREYLIRHLGDVPVTVEHRHVMMKDLWKCASKSSKDLIRWLIIAVLLLIFVITGMIYWYFTSNAHWNAVRVELLQSTLLTDEERNTLTGKNFILDSEVAAPLDYYPNSKKEFLKRMVQALEYRKSK